MPKNTLLTDIFSIIPGLILGICLVAAAWILTMNQAKTARNTAIQGCYEVAKGMNLTTGKGDTSDWSVQDSRVNQDILSDCLNRKGI